MKFGPTFLAETFLTYIRKLIAESGESAALREIDDGLKTGDAPEQERASKALMRILPVISRLPNSLELAYTLGQRVPLTAFGSLAQVMRMAPTPREGLRLLGDCQHLLTSIVLYRFSGSRGEAGEFTVSIDYPLDADSMEIFLMAIVSTIDKELSLTSGRSGNISAIQFNELSEKARQSYRERFDVGASGGHPANSVLLPAAILDRDNPAADPETYAVKSREWQRRARVTNKAERLPELIRQQIAAHIAEPPDIAEIAERAKLTPRQLVFALEKSGTSYREILRDTRLAVIEDKMKDPGLRINDIAEQLGYSDAAAFTHSFKRWTGTTPGSYRKKLLAGNG